MTPENQMPTDEEMRLIRDAEILDRAHQNLMTDLKALLALCQQYRIQIAALEKQLKEASDKKA